jgi:MoaA/NifB/PqqE/SkfB family radical SAM enzyme
MSDEDIAFFVGEIARQPGVAAVAVTGGEPMMRIKRFQHLVETAHQHGLKTMVTSNCFWAKTLDVALEVLAPLAKMGLVVLGASYDEQHAPFIEPERVKNAVFAALRLGMQINLNCAVTRGESLDPDELCAKFGLTRELVKIYARMGQPIRIALDVLQLSGTAREHYGPEDLVLEDPARSDRASLVGPCVEIFHSTMVVPSGELSVCCSPAVANRDGFRDEFVMGNLRETPLSELIRQMGEDPLWAAIRDRGPWTVYREVQERFPGALPRETFVNYCDICATMMATGLPQRLYGGGRAPAADALVTLRTRRG